MNFLAVAAGLPVTMLVIWALVRSPLAARVSAEPREDRWHRRPTPMVGGIGIFAGLVTGFLLAIAAGASPASRELLAIVGGCGVLFVAGLLDDLFSLGPLPKLAGQIGAAAIVIFNGVTISGLIRNDFLAGEIGRAHV